MKIRWFHYDIIILIRGFPMFGKKFLYWNSALETFLHSTHLWGYRWSSMYDQPSQSNYIWAESNQIHVATKSFYSIFLFAQDTTIQYLYTLNTNWISQRMAKLIFADRKYHVIPKEWNVYNWRNMFLQILITTKQNCNHHVNCKVRTYRWLSARLQ